MKKLVGFALPLAVALAVFSLGRKIAVETGVVRPKVSIRSLQTLRDEAQLMLERGGPAKSGSLELATKRPIEMSEEFSEFGKIRRKVVRSVLEQAEHRRRLSNPAMLEEALNLLSQSESEDDHLAAVDYIMEGLASPDAEVRSAFIDSVGGFIETANLSEGTLSERRQRAGDVAEMTISLVISVPEARGRLLTRTQGLNHQLVERSLDYLSETSRNVAAIHAKGP